MPWKYGKAAAEMRVCGLPEAKCAACRMLGEASPFMLFGTAAAAVAAALGASEVVAAEPARVSEGGQRESVPPEAEESGG